MSQGNTCSNYNTKMTSSTVQSELKQGEIRDQEEGDITVMRVCSAEKCGGRKVEGLSLRDSDEDEWTVLPT